MRVSEYLHEQHVPFETMIHPPAFTAQKLARFLRVSGRKVLKSVLLVGPGERFLALLPATHHVDLAMLSSAVGPVRLATDDEVADQFRDCERGAVTPFGRLYGLTTLLEDSIAPDAQIVFEAERHAIAIRMRCHDFEKLEKPRRLRFARVSDVSHPRAS
jgi:Ala-tRNA(Pro) deacylase